jgi:hypothetical protein
MPRRTTAFFAAATFTALATGCAQTPEPPGDAPAGLAPGGDDGPSDLSPEGVSMNGVSMNGVSMNGVSMNGVSMNGTGLSALTLDGVSLSGITVSDTMTLSDVTLRATVFGGRKPDGSWLDGNGFVSAIFRGRLSNGQTLRLRVEDRRQLAAPNADVYAYRVSYQNAAGWSPLCGLDAAQQPVFAVPLNGTWDQRQGVAGGGAYAPSATQFTFGCRGHALAKCVELGYKPWRAAGRVPLQEHLNACVRMLRADYCGDGTSWTVAGTPVNVYDGAGIQSDDCAWSFEAEWTAAGARFVAPATRKRYELAGSTVPWCIASKTWSGAGAVWNFATGTLLMNEY